MRQVEARGRRPRLLRIAQGLFVALAFFLLLFGYKLASLYTDWEWFDELGQSSVFTTSLSASVTLYLGFGLLFFLVCYFNVWLAQRLAASQPRPRLLDDEREKLRAYATQATRWLALGGSIFFAFTVGASAASHWSDYLLFTHGQSFGVADPIFHRDASFYVFRLPFLSYLVSWGLVTLGITAVGAGLIHYGNRALDSLGEVRPVFVPGTHRHLVALLGMMALLFAFSLALGRYDLLYAENRAFYGAGYTDVHARLPAINLQVLAMAATAVLCFANVWRGRPYRLPLIGLAVWAAIAVVGGGIAPYLLQEYVVTPNQFGMERQYIAHDLQFTQRAYGLDRVKELPFSGAGAVTAAGLAADRGTISSVRLWDWPQLALVYQAKQKYRPYYSFDLPQGQGLPNGDYNVDVDRYHLPGGYSQVMLAPRELDASQLPQEARTWQNLHLQYTHGYGAVMSPVNRVDVEGLPEYLMGTIPVKSAVSELELTKPQIYFGELTRDYVFVDTKQNEFDYPAGEGSVETRYTGKAGVRLSSSLARLAWSVRLGDTNLVLSSDLGPQTRILFRRSIRQRVAALAPFMQWDRDPYLVVDGGRLYWILDGFTTTDRFPYAKPSIGPDGDAFNYIRNSVKAVVDAYDGTVRFYAADKRDPILQTWRRIFGTLFIDMDKMPDGLRAHVRYPEDLFRIQRDVFKLYHITDPRVYYGKEDAWEVPLDPTASEGGGGQKMMPYYVMMRLPGEEHQEFMMITPFTPLSAQNLTAWMCVKCDPDDYGQILVYRFPRGSAVNGPQQIMNQIRSQPDISQMQTLMGQRGSQVIFGNLIAIPIDSALLYAVPLYVQGDTGGGGGAIPQIRQVIVASGDKIVMRRTLNEALTALAGNAEPVAEDTGPPPAQQPPGAAAQGAAPPAGAEELLRRATTSYQKARQKQQEYNRSLDDLGRALQDLQKGMGGNRR